jgi:hypothetical protein
MGSEQVDLDGGLLAQLHLLLAPNFSKCFLWAQACLQFLSQVWPSLSFKILNKANKLMSDCIRTCLESLQKTGFGEKVLCEE